MATHEAPPEAEDFSQPILPGDAGSDYERYLNTVGLLALQKGPDEWVHRDELLFQVLKLGISSFSCSTGFLAVTTTLVPFSESLKMSSKAAKIVSVRT